MCDVCVFMSACMCVARCPILTWFLDLKSSLIGLKSFLIVFVSLLTGLAYLICPSPFILNTSSAPDSRGIFFYLFLGICCSGESFSFYPFVRNLLFPRTNILTFFVRKLESGIPLFSFLFLGQIFRHFRAESWIWDSFLFSDKLSMWNPESGIPSSGDIRVFLWIFSWFMSRSCFLMPSLVYSLFESC